MKGNENGGKNGETGESENEMDKKIGRKVEYVKAKGIWRKEYKLTLITLNFPYALDTAVVND